MSDPEAKIYSDLAEWWPLMSAPDDYAEEAAFYTQVLKSGCAIRPRTLLELGSGGGNNAVHMKRHFEQVTLTDLSDGMLAHSRRLNPDCEHLVGDMRTLRLDRVFDCVFIHDAVTYMASQGDLRQAMATAFVHCAPGGAALFAPDTLKETYQDSTECGGHDHDSRAMRYLEWTWDPDPEDETCTTDYVYTLREADGSVRVVHDRHIEGVFSRETWLRLLRETGFDATVIMFDHSELEPGTYHLLLARKPSL
jgi:ubiquinone/menaquinone biosynthesis C-methylase UbiE